jgi:hypothetical protein
MVEYCEMYLLYWDIKFLSILSSRFASSKVVTRSASAQCQRSMQVLEESIYMFQNHDERYLTVCVSLICKIQVTCATFRSRMCGSDR